MKTLFLSEVYAGYQVMQHMNRHHPDGRLIRWRVIKGGSVIYFIG